MRCPKNHVILIALEGAAQAMMCLGDPCKGVRIILSGGVRGETQQSLSLARYRGAMRRLAFAAQVFASIRSARLRWIMATGRAVGADRYSRLKRRADLV